MVATIKYNGKVYPYRVGYRALKHVKSELGREYEHDETEMDYEGLECLFWHAIEGEHIKQKKELDLKREDMEFVLDECLPDLISSIVAFSQAVTKLTAQPQKAKAKN